MISEPLTLDDITQGNAPDTIVWPLTWLDEALILFIGHATPTEATRRMTGNSSYDELTDRPCATTLRWALFDKHTANCDGFYLDELNVAYDLAIPAEKARLEAMTAEERRTRNPQPAESCCWDRIGQHTGEDDFPRLVHAATPGTTPVTITYWKSRYWQACPAACPCTTGQYDTTGPAATNLADHIALLHLPGLERTALDREAASTTPGNTTAPVLPLFEPHTVST